MKNVISLFVLLITLTLAISAGGGNGKGGKVAPPPNIVVSPSTYTSGTPLTWTGSGFSPKQDVFIDMEGPNSLGISTTTDKNGNFSVYYPGGVYFALGYYTVTASQSDGTNATTGLEVD